MKSMVVATNVGVFKKYIKCGCGHLFKIDASNHRKNWFAPHGILIVQCPSCNQRSLPTIEANDATQASSDQVQENSQALQHN